MTALLSSKRRLIVLALFAAALAGVAAWLLVSPPWKGPSHPATVWAPESAQRVALTVNGEPILYEDLAVAARRAEAASLEGKGLSASRLEGANGAFVRLVLLREAAVGLIPQAIVRQEARARNLTVAESKIEEATQQGLAQLVEKSRSSGRDIESLLFEVGQTLDEFTADLREETRIRLVSDEVALAVVGSVTPLDEELRALYESNAATYGSDFEKALDKVRSDYNRQEVARRRDAWIAAQLEKADVRFADPILAAFDLVKKYDDEGLATLERLFREKKVYDPYLPYYIGRIYNDHAIAAFAERQELEKTLGQAPTAEQTARVEAARTREKEYTSQAALYYVATLTTAPADDALLRSILQLNPPQAVRALAIGLGALAADNPTTARSELKKALDLDASLDVARVALADLAAQEVDKAEALSLYQSAALRAARSADMLLSIADACLSIDQLDEAAKQISAARAVAPEYARLWIAEGDLALRRLHAATAERDLLAAQPTRSAEEESKHATLSQMVAELYDAVRSAYDRALVSSESETLLIRVGRAELLVGKAEAAMDLFRAVLRRSTHYPEAHVGLGDVLVSRGDTRTALAHYEAALGQISETSQQLGVLARVLNVNPTNGTVRIAYAIALTRLRQWNDAITEFSRILDAQPDLIQAHLWIAESYAALGDYETAVAHLKRGLGTMATPAAKDSACAQIVTVVRRQVTAGGTPSTDSLDTLFEVARNRLGSGYPGECVEALALLAATDPAYRQAEVARLLQAAKTASTKQTGTMD